MELKKNSYRECQGKKGACNGVREKQPHAIRESFFLFQFLDRVGTNPLIFGFSGKANTWGGKRGEQVKGEIKGAGVASNLRRADSWTEG